MKGIIAGFTSIINLFKMVFGMVMSFFKTIAMVFVYLINIVDIAFDVILNLPEWLKAFAVITISISIAYFLIGRNAGKSD